MVNDLISRQAAVYAIDEMSYAFNVKTNAHMAFVKALAKLPSAERREVQSSECEYWDDESNFCTLYRPSAERRGRWIFNIDNKGWSWDKPYVCDQCGEWVEKVFKFCPSCGARMEGEKE